MAANAKDASSQDNTEKVPPEQKGVFSSFLKSLVSFTGDLSALTCPAFLLAPVSLIEYSEYWTQRPELFAAIAQEPDNLNQMVAFIKWFISSLNASYSSRVPKGEWEKKPYNPVLGEQFFSTWKSVDGCGETHVICEQVSHHPPVTGFYIHNDDAHISLNGHTGQKTRFSSTTLICEQVGHTVLTIDGGNSYVFTSPSLTVNGIWRAAPYVELTGTSYVQSSSGYFAIIEYSSAGWVSGERNHIKCQIYQSGKSEKEYLYRIEGQWSGKSTIKARDSRELRPFLDINDVKTRATVHVKPVEEQGDMESRRIWRHVSEAIREGDTQKAGEEKSKIENQKRVEKRDRDEQGVSWQPTYFEWQSSEESVEHLTSMLTSNLSLFRSSSSHFAPSSRGNWVHKKNTQ